MLQLLLLAALAGAAQPSDVPSPQPPELWPDEQREFFLDGPAWLLPAAERAALAALGEAERAAAIERFISAAELPGISAAELAEAIRRRRALMRSEFLSPTDVRARLLFLRGAPIERLVIDCAETFEPLELWAYPVPGVEEDPEARQELLVYRPGPGRPWQLWTPAESKRVLYTREMEYYLEQWEENDGRMWTATRFDLQSCPETPRVDRATGVRALRVYRKERPQAGTFLPYLDPPEDLARWVKQAAATPLADGPEPLAAALPPVLFPARAGQRLVAQVQVRLDEPWELPTAPAEAEGAPPEARVTIEGLVEEGSSVFDDFRVRFLLPQPAEGEPALLAFDVFMRPDQDYVVRLRVRDELSGRSAYLVQGFRVPSEPRDAEQARHMERVIKALGEAVAEQRVAGQDGVILVPPATEIVLARWRAEAIVTGDRIAKIAFSVDGEAQLTDNRAPYSAELRLARYPVEQVVRAEGLDAAGELVAADEVVLNQPRGAFAVRIVEPPPGADLGVEEVEVIAQVVVPDGRRVEEVVFQIDGEEMARLERPPWRANVLPPIGSGLSYLSVSATLDDGRRGEDVRLLNAPDYVEQIDVDLVELYAAVTDRDGRPVKGLTAEDFEVLVGGRPVPVHRFETVNDLPLTVGMTMDASGSMASNLVVAQEAARDFLTNIISVKDHAFAVGFSDFPVLLMPPTSDIDAVADALGKLRSVGWTALHDAIVTSLYYFRGFPGQKVLVLLSDGDDTRSTYSFDDAVEYARRSGAAVYSVGIGVGGVAGFGGARAKLKTLSDDTGGRAYMIARAEDLTGVYAELEEELRSRYMLAVAPPPGSGADYQQVEVRVKGRGLSVRTARGIYP